MWKDIKVRAIEHLIQALNVEKYKGTCNRAFDTSIKCRTEFTGILLICS
jgi:hypothetical protein